MRIARQADVYAALALFLTAPLFFGQTGGAPNHSNGSTTRTQTMQVGEPYTNAPGGNPGRTTGKTGNQSPFGNNPRTPPPARPAPNPAPGACAATSTGNSQALYGGAVPSPQAPTQILNYPVTYNGGAAVVGVLSIDSDADPTNILCLLDKISRTNTGTDVIRGIQTEGTKRSLTVAIVRPDAGMAGPSTRPGSGGDLDWLRAQPSSLPVVYSSQPVRPKTAAGVPDFNADGIVQPAISKIVVFGAGVAGIRGKGVSSTVRFSQSMFPLNALGIRQSSNAGADVGLIHELIHCLRHIDGLANRTPVFKAGDNTMADAKWLTVDEREVIGDNTVPANWATENRYRAEVGISPRNCVAPTCF